MGYKSDGKRNYITHYLAVGCLIAAIAIVACTPVQEKIAAIKAHQQLEQYRKKLADGFFETIIQQGNQVVDNNAIDPPADIAFYALGEVYAHNDFTGKDFGLSQYYFEKLIENFPDSPLTSEARVYISLFETIAAKEKEATILKLKSAEKDKLALKKSKKKSTPAPHKRVENQNFDKAIMKNQQIIDNASNKKSIEGALYSLGLIYANAENPQQDYKKSQFYFHLLTEQFPESEFVDEVEVMINLFETIEKIQQIDIDIEEQKKQLNQ